MRELSEGEAAVVSALLGTGLEPQATALRRSGVPRSTFTVIRRKAFQEGWLYERYLPSAALGAEHALFALGRPFAESARAVLQRWSEEPSAVYLTGGVDLLFGAFLLKEGRSAALATRLEADPGLEQLKLWKVEAAPSSIPVYFDYEGVWSHWTGQRSLRYPRPFPPGPRKPSGEPPSPGLRETAREIVERPFRETPGSEELHRFGPAGFPRSWRRLLARGYLEWRVFPDFSTIPPFQGGRLDRVALLHGTLRDDHTPADLFRDLVGLSRVFPFLYVIENQRVLLGALGRMGSGGGGAGEDRAPVLPTLERHLSGVGVAAVGREGLAIPRDHRYETLLT